MLNKIYNLYIRKRIISFSLLIFISIFFGCENNPNELGLNYIANDTIGTIVLDSQRDSILITSSNFLKYVNTSNSVNIFVGNYQNYTSKSLLKFYGITSSYDSAVVLSAVLKLKYNNYALEDSNGTTSFNIYKLNRDYNFDTVTYDQFSSSDIGTTVLGTYTGVLRDTVQISIPFDNQTIKDWLQYAVDTNYVNKNYGVILVPNSNSNNIKAFSSYISGSSALYPTIVAVVAKNGTVDTLTFSTSQSVSLNTVPSSIIPSGEILLQNGVTYKDIIKIDPSKIPANSLINEATLTLKIDKAKSFISSSTSSTDVRLLVNMLTDSSSLTNDGTNYYSTQPDSVTYSITFNYAFQKWVSGTSNFGILIKNIYDYSNLDRYVFYSTNYPDVDKRPRLKIRYTLRR
jgi:hypothetical protein